MLPPDAVRKAAFKRKAHGPSIAIVIGAPKGAPPKPKDEDEEYEAPAEESAECACPKCGHVFDPAEAKNADAEEQDEEQAEEDV